MEPGELIQKKLYEEHLSYEWLIAQLNRRGLTVGKTAISLAFTSKRTNDTSQRMPTTIKTMSPRCRSSTVSR